MSNNLRVILAAACGAFIGASYGLTWHGWPGAAISAVVGAAAAGFAYRPVFVLRGTYRHVRQSIGAVWTACALSLGHIHRYPLRAAVIAGGFSLVLLLMGAVLSLEGSARALLLVVTVVVNTCVLISLAVCLECFRDEFKALEPTFWDSPLHVRLRLCVRAASAPTLLILRVAKMLVLLALSPAVGFVATLVAGCRELGALLVMIGGAIGAMAGYFMRDPVRGAAVGGLLGSAVFAASSLFPLFASAKVRVWRWTEEAKNIQIRLNVQT